MFPSIFISAQQPSTLTQQTLNSNIVRKSAATAEIIWALKSVVSAYANSSYDDIANTLKAMCPDSQIAKDSVTLNLCKL